MRSAWLLPVLAVLACGGESSGPTTPAPPPPPPPPPAQALPAALAVAAGDSQQTSPAAPVVVAPAVLVKDSAGVPMAGVLVHFTVGNGGGTITGDTVRTGTSGVASVGSWILGPLPGENQLSASAGTLNVTFTATARLLVPTLPASGTVTLPDGARVGPGTLRVVTGLADVPVAPNGAFHIVVEPGQVQFAAVHAPNGNPILFGWLTGQPAHLTPRGTAEVLAYFDLGSYLAPDSATRRAAREAIATQVDLGPLEAAITAALAADPANVTLVTPSVERARINLLTSLAAAGRTGKVAGLIVDPAGEKSGVTVDQVGFRGITITNNWRRRVFAFVDRDSYVPKGSTTSVYSPSLGPPIRLPAVTPVTTLIGTFIDLLFGNFAWVPVVSPVQSTPVFPIDALSTQYVVTVVGAGRGIGTTALTVDQQVHQIRATAETFLFDFLAPLVDQYFNSKNVERYKLGQPDVDNAVTQFLDLNPTPLFEAMSGGDWKATFNELFKLIFDSGAGQQFLVEVFLVPDYAEKGLSNLLALDKVVNKWSKVLQAIEVVATSVAVVQVVSDVVSAQATERWNVSVGGALVSLTPDVAHISKQDIQTFRATVTDATGGGPMPVFGYRWSTTGQFGKICASRTDQGTNYCGTSFESSQDVITYLPHGIPEGTDDIMVEVVIRETGVAQSVGEATAKVTAYGAKISISPVNVSIKPGETTNLSATVDTQLQDGGTMTYRWVTSGSVGSFLFGLTDTEVQSSTITYVAKANVEGSDAVTVYAISTKDGARRILGSATATVAVEPDQPTVVQGTWMISPAIPLASGRSCIGAFITFPLVPGAKSYEMHAYGFNDTAHWGQDIRMTLYPPFQAYRSCGQYDFLSGEMGGSYYFMLTSGAGPSGGIPASIALMQSRFAGMTVEVIVRY